MDQPTSTSTESAPTAEPKNPTPNNGNSGVTAGASQDPAERQQRNQAWLQHAELGLLDHNARGSFRKRALVGVRREYPSADFDYLAELGDPYQWAQKHVTAARAAGHRVDAPNTPGVAPTLTTGLVVTVVLLLMWLATFIGVGWFGAVSLAAVGALVLHVLVVGGVMIELSTRDFPSRSVATWLLLAPVAYLAAHWTAASAATDPAALANYWVLAAAGGALAVTVLGAVLLRWCHDVFAMRSEKSWLAFATFGMMNHAVWSPSERRALLRRVLAAKKFDLDAPGGESLRKRFGTPADFHGANARQIIRLAGRVPEPSEGSAGTFITLLPVSTLSLAFFMVLFPTGGGEAAMAAAATFLVILQFVQGFRQR